MYNRLLSFFVSGSLLASAFGLNAAEEVTISEFLASNQSGLRDEDNQLGDWIEIHNSGLAAVNLDGWYLTDNANNKTKWRFPATNIAAGAYMVIFADGKDRRVPGATLHANFNLSANGEYLGLIKPDGVTVASQFSPTFPGQAPDVSYGFSSLTTNFTAMNTNAGLRWRIPDGTETNWYLPAYNDSAWAAGTNGVGYGTFQTVDYGQAVLPTAPVVYYRMNETSGSTAANLGSGGSPGTYNAVTLGTAGPRPPAFNGFENDNNAPTFGGSGYVAGPVGLLSGRGSYTVAGWIKPAGAQAGRTGLFGQNDAVEFGFIDASTIQCWTPNGSVNATWSIPANIWVHLVAVANGSTIRVFTNGVLAATGSGTSSGSSSFAFNIGGGGIFDTSGNFFNGQIDEVAVYHRALSDGEIAGLYNSGLASAGGSSSTLIRTDVGAAMSNVNASAYLRIPFTVATASNASLITLRARHNDGFVAYINGVEALRLNAPETNVFNSAATEMHSSVALETFLLGPGALVPGTNILAVQGLNIAADDTNFLFEAHLTITSVQAESSTALYFTVPTPGAANLGGIANPGPAILDVKHTPHIPADHDDLVVTARIVPTFYPVSNVVVRYRVMFSPEIELQMFDDGAHGDGAAADGIWGATIPAASAATNGQAIRWFFRAWDNRGNASRWPLFAKPNDSAEYLGAVVNPGYVTSKLSIIHIFAAPGILSPVPNTAQTGADSQAGARVSLYYDGEFYDNIHMELRGNSTAGFEKKSHRLEFNREHTFRHSNGFPRIRKTSFVADYPDPTYMRQGLSYLLCDMFGAPAPFYHPVRLQLNANFYQLANHNDVHGEELLERLGFDPRGALYNAAGQVTTSRASTGGFDKKTRTWETGDVDYLALAARLAETNSIAARTTNVFDWFDVPEALNYLVVARWIHENDDVWANMSLYHDNDGDDLWRIVPFDLNLSWGAIFAEGDASLYQGVQATNDTHKAHPLYGGANILARSGPGGAFNRVYDTFFKVPVLREMFLRRLRTLLDTHVGPIGTPTNSTALEQLILARRDLIAEEANRDRSLWGWRASPGGQNNFVSGIGITNGVDDMLNQFFRTRRIHFYGKHLITNTALPLFDGIIAPASNTVAGIPLAQPTNAVIQIGAIESNPSSGLQGHEFIQLTNPNPYAVDISGWKLDGGVDFTFKPGTVMGSNTVLYVTPDIRAYRTRTTIPMPGRGLFVVGEYQGQFDARGEPVFLYDERGRSVHTNSYLPSPSLAQLFLRITELMYFPARTNAGSPYGTEDFEYIELKNIGLVNLDLVGIHFTNGITFAFTPASPVTNLAPGQVVVLVKNSAAYASRYGGGATIAGVYTGNLDNSGERISLHDKVGEQILDFRYNNSWYPITEGLGFSLVVVDEGADWTAWDTKEQWRPSAENTGSPGMDDPAAPGPFAGILVNEVLPNTDAPDVDLIELHNPTTNAVDIGHWWISDDYFQPQKYRIPSPWVVPAGGYAVFSEADFNMGPTAFSFSSQGDEAFLFSGNSAGNLNGYAQGFDFGASATGVAFGRYVNSQTNTHFVAMSSNTFGFQNSAPRVGPIIISELMYHPPDDDDGADNSLDEFVELQNITTNDVWLHDLANPANRWQLDDGVNYSFSTTDVVPANGFLLVVNFNPTNTAQLNAFVSKYGVPPNTPIVGPYSGKLDNAGERVELKRPDAPNGGNVPLVLIDRVNYKDQAPWDAYADGFGPSLQRLVASDYGNDPTNWVAAAPNPGAAFVGGTSPIVTDQPDDATGVAGRSTNSFSVTADGSGLRYQWHFNGAALPGATNATIVIENVQFANAGDYSVLVMNGAGVAVSSNAHLTVLGPVTFTIQPTDQYVLPGTNVTIVSQAVGNGTVRYQWSFEGVEIEGATNATYSFTNANLNEHHGTFSVVAMDDVSVTHGSNALVFVLVRPVFVVNPQPTTVLAGQNATFTAMATGAPPIWYRWLVQGAAVATNNTGVFVFSNALINRTIRVLATNSATTAAGVNMSPAGGVTMTVLADADRDGMWDQWETNYFGTSNTTNNPNNALEDPDGDGMINRDEYVAGTNPTNALSVLKLFVSGGGLEFVAQTNIGYSVQFNPILSSTNWTVLTNVAAQPSQVRTIQVNAPNPPPDPERFYRVVTPPVTAP